MLEVGDKAPTFDLMSDAGSSVRSADFKGKTLVVYFYPKDDTPGCTTEAIAFSEAAERFAAAGAAIVGISKDSVASHSKFKGKYSLDLSLLSDPELTVHNAFGSYGEKMMYGKKTMGTIRSTFVINPKGIVTHVFPRVKVPGHADAVLAAITGKEAPEEAPAKATKVPAKKAATKAKPKV